MAEGQGLDKTTLVNEILSLLGDMRKEKTDSDSKFANSLANIIEKYVKSGKVITVGSATTQTGKIQ